MKSCAITRRKREEWKMEVERGEGEEGGRRVGRWTEGRDRVVYASRA